MKKDLIQFFHFACFSPSKDTFLKAIKNGNYISWPGLTYDVVNKYLDVSAATKLGRLQQERKIYNQLQKRTLTTFWYQIPRTRKCMKFTLSYSHLFVPHIWLMETLLIVSRKFHPVELNTS